jgi:hypothetical protein
MQSVFAGARHKQFPYRFEGTLLVGKIAGGVPTDPKVAESWLRANLGEKTDDQIRRMAAETMIDRGVTLDDAVALVNDTRHLNGFRRDDEGLYIAGYQLKAALKEAVSVAAAADKIKLKGWGKTNKGIHSYFVEHVFVVEERLHLGVMEPSGIAQRFPHNWRGTSIQYEEYVEDAKIDFTIISDHDFTDDEWAAIWLTGEQQGIGATRSQGYGRYEVIRWERCSQHRS